MSISVIIPVYNHAVALRPCLLSLAKQTVCPKETIIINDGSTDNFEKVIREIIVSEEFKKLNIQVVSQENKGSAAARNRGFAGSTGDLVIFWDADTVAEPLMLEKLQSALLSHPEASYAYCGYKFGFKKMPSRDFDASALRQNNYIDTTSLIRRQDFLGFDEKLKRFIDWDLWLTLLEKNKTGVFVPEILFTKLVGKRKGISQWLPRFAFKLPWQIQSVKDFLEARKIVRQKHEIE